MKKLLLFVMVVVPLCADEQMKISGKLKVYNIGTYKQSGSVNTLDSNALAIGGQLGVTTKRVSGLFAHVNFMTTNGLFVDSDPSRVDGSILAKDIKAVSGIASDVGKSITLIGEAYTGYENESFMLKVGRQKYDSPLAAQKEVRMLPSTFSGSAMEFKMSGHRFGIAYFDKFKQRTSDRFYNILEHALGSNTQAYTGKDKGALLIASVDVNEKFRLYNYRMEAFFNALYVDYKGAFSGWEWAVQGIYQESIGYFDTAMKNGVTLFGTKRQGMKVTSAGLKLSKRLDRDKYTFAVTHTADHADAYSDIIAPFDGTPLFTDTITGNNLFKSLYGGALDADSGYKAGTLGLKIAYDHQASQKMKMTVAAARFDRGLDAAQTDINGVISYKLSGWDLAVKAIFVFDNAQVAGDKLQQYRLIGSYKF